MLSSPRQHPSKMLLRSTIAFFAGASLTLAFSPFNFAISAFIAPAILLWLSLISSKSKTTLLGWVFGFGFFATSASWVYISIHTYGGTNAILATLLTGLFVATLALFPMVSLLLFRLMTPTLTLWRILVFFPFAWLFGEWLRSWIASGFPWVILGYSQINTPLKGFIPLIGAYGVSILTTICSVLIYFICMKSSSPKLKVSSFLSLGLLFGTGSLLSTIHWTIPLSPTLTVSLVQGNISQDIKWSDQHFSEILESYEQLTQPELGRNLIVWPEGSIPTLAEYVPNFLAKMDQSALSHHSTLLLGTILGSEQESLYNGILVLGNSEGIYAKRHLVPFGEYLPLSHWLRGLINFFNIPMSDLTTGDLTPSLLNIDGLFLSPSICYEVAYPSLVWYQADKANILINISDDSWFAHSIAAAQQLQISQVRALETGRSMIVVNNNGITAVISPQGKILAALPANKPGVLRATVTGYTKNTPLIQAYEAILATLRSND